VMTANGALCSSAFIPLKRPCAERDICFQGIL
jgi:hypothetical protein